ncbi:MAG: hypothetical protein MZU84_04365 [Sphingobacterium sp.]|nr:hypothetical protein [Sphingobacterium sp.]
MPGGEPRLRAGDQLGRRVQAHPEAVRDPPAAGAAVAREGPLTPQPGADDDIEGRAGSLHATGRAARGALPPLVRPPQPELPAVRARAAAPGRGRGARAGAGARWRRARRRHADRRAVARARRPDHRPRGGARARRAGHLRRARGGRAHAAPRLRPRPRRPRRHRRGRADDGRVDARDDGGRAAARRHRRGGRGRDQPERHGVAAWTCRSRALAALTPPTCTSPRRARCARRASR